MDYRLVTLDASSIAGQVVTSNDRLRGVVQLPGARGSLLNSTLRAVTQTEAEEGLC